MDNSTGANRAVWERLYNDKKSLLSYPDSNLVSLSWKLLSLQDHKKVLDYGFGSASNTLMLLRRGFQAYGVEVSESAILYAAQVIREGNFTAELELLNNDGTIPFNDHFFDAVIAWQVLCYNSWDTLSAAVLEIDRVLRPGGIFIGTMTAIGDISSQRSICLGDNQYESRCPGQEGARLLVVDEQQLVRCFPGHQLNVGKICSTFGDVTSSHWVVSYQK